MGEADFGSSLPLSSQLELEQPARLGLRAQLLAVVPGYLSLLTAANLLRGVYVHPSVRAYSSREKQDESVSFLAPPESAAPLKPFLNPHFL